MNPRYAYITIATSKDYLEGLMAMSLSLRRTGTTIPLYALLPQKLIEEITPWGGYFNLRQNGVNIIPFKHSLCIPQELKENILNGENPRFARTFDKFLIFELTQFSKVVYLDVDIYILHSLDGLFSMPHMSACVAGKSYPGNENWIELNSGIMTIVPEDGMVEKLMGLIPTVMQQKNDFGDQDILQAYCPDWPEHPELDMGEKYNILSYYAEYYYNNLGYRYTDTPSDPFSVGLVHFAAQQKPWMRKWSLLSVVKQEVQLWLRHLIHRRDTRTVLLEYNHLVRRARRLLYRPQMH